MSKVYLIDNLKSQFIGSHNNYLIHSRHLNMMVKLK